MLIAEPTATEKNTEKKMIAIIVTVFVHVALGIVLFLITAVPAIRDEPELIAKVVGDQISEEKKTDKQTVMKQIRQAPTTSAAKPIAQMIQARSAATMIAPKVAKVSEGPIGLGQGEFGAGFGADSTGMGSGVSFFGSRSTGRRFLFILDHSASMQVDQLDLRNRELKQALYKLPKGIQYQVILFGGGAMFAEPGWKGQDVDGGKKFEVTDPGRKKYTFSRYRSANDWEFEGRDEDLPRAKWIPVNRASIERTLSTLNTPTKFLGTDWEIALKVGHLMRPPPDVIFFMSDGSGGNAPRPILELNQKYGRPVINTFAMQTTDGARQFFEISQKTGGEFVIVQRDGRPVKVTDPAKIEL